MPYLMINVLTIRELAISLVLNNWALAFFLAVRSKELFPIVDLDVSDQAHSS